MVYSIGEHEVRGMATRWKDLPCACSNRHRQGKQQGLICIAPHRHPLFNKTLATAYNRHLRGKGELNREATLVGQICLAIALMP